MWKARLVNIFTTTSSLCLGEYPQIVAGRIMTVVKSSEELLALPHILPSESKVTINFERSP